jgi:hypothetical protein
MLGQRNGLLKTVKPIPFYLATLQSFHFCRVVSHLGYQFHFQVKPFETIRNHIIIIWSSGLLLVGQDPDDTLI